MSMITTVPARNVSPRLLILLLLALAVLPWCGAQQTTAPPQPGTLPAAAAAAAAAASAYRLNIIVNDFMNDPASAVASLGPTFSNHTTALLRRLNVELSVNVTAAKPGALVAEADGVDVVWTHPAAVAELMQKFNYTPLVSMENVALGMAESKFGGVFITHTGASAAHVISEDDCAREPVRLATISRKGFGGFLMHFKHLLDRGAVTPAFYDNPGIVQTGSQLRVVDMVNVGNVTCGVVRTNVLESLDAERTRNVRVLGQRNDSAAVLFPFAVTTAFYPEWTVAVHPRVPAELQNLLREALLTVRSNSAVALTGGYSRFFPAVSHAAVLEMLWSTGVLPRPPTPPPPAQPLMPAWAVAMLAVTATALVFVAGAGLRRALRRDPLEFAPRNAAEPFAVGFLAVKGLTSLRGADPEAAAVLVADLRRVVREEVRAHEVYEGPPAGDAVMVCGHSAAAVVETVSAVRARLDADDWAGDANEALLAPRARRPTAARSLNSASASEVASLPSNMSTEHGAVHSDRAGTSVRSRPRSRGAAAVDPLVTLRAGVHFGFGFIETDQAAVDAARGGDSTGCVPYRYTGPVVDVAAAATDSAGENETIITAALRDALEEDGLGAVCANAVPAAAVGDAGTYLLNPPPTTSGASYRSTRGSAAAGGSIRTSGGVSPLPGGSHSFDAIDSVSAAAQAATGALVRKRVTAVAVYFDTGRAGDSCSPVGPTQAEVDERLKALDDHVSESGATLLVVAHDGATVCFNAHVPALDQVRQAAEFCDLLRLIFNGRHGVRRVTTGLATGTALVGKSAVCLGDGRRTNDRRAGGDAQLRPVVFGQCLTDAVAAELAMRQAVAWNGGKALGTCCGVPADHADAGQLLSVVAIGPLDCWAPRGLVATSGGGGGAGDRTRRRRLAAAFVSLPVDCGTLRDEEWLYTVATQTSPQVAVVNAAATSLMLADKPSPTAPTPLQQLQAALDGVRSALEGITSATPDLLDIGDAIVARALLEGDQYREGARAAHTDEAPMLPGIAALGGSEPTSAAPAPSYTSAQPPWAMHC